MKPRSFPAGVLDRIHRSPIIGIKAGRAPHRVIGVWAVVAARRVFIRSWSLKKEGWLAAFRKDPVGELHLDGRKFRIRPVFVRAERVKTMVSKAYAEKYHTPGSIHYVKDMARKKSRDTTTELAPAAK